MPIIKYFRILSAFCLRIKYSVLNHWIHKEIKFKDLIDILFKNYYYKHYYRKK